MKRNTVFCSISSILSLSVSTFMIGSIDRSISSTCWKILFCDDDNLGTCGSGNTSESLSIPVSKWSWLKCDDKVYSIYKLMKNYEKVKLCFVDTKNTKESMKMIKEKNIKCKKATRYTMWLLNKVPFFWLWTEIN